MEHKEIKCIKDNATGECYDIVDAGARELINNINSCGCVTDTELSETSENPVQNKVVTEELKGKLNVDISKYSESELDKNTGCYILYYHNYYKSWIKKAVAQNGSNGGKVIAGNNDGQIKQQLAPVNPDDLTNKEYVDSKAGGKLYKHTLSYTDEHMYIQIFFYSNQQTIPANINELPEHIKNNSLRGCNAYVMDTVDYIEWYGVVNNAVLMEDIFKITIASASNTTFHNISNSFDSDSEGVEV